MPIDAGNRRREDAVCALLGYYAACGGNSLPTFRNNLSVPSSRVTNPLYLEDGPIGCPEPSVKNYRYTLRIPVDRRLLLLHGGSLK